MTADATPDGVVRQLDEDAHGVQLIALWGAATDARRDQAGLPRLVEGGRSASALARPGAFAVGVVEGSLLVAAAVALPALEDNARSPRVMPGMMHVSSVATLPDRWGLGLGRRVMQAILTHGIRRGYARCQLWTYAANPAARHLYESLGFALSGRTFVDKHGEETVHYVRELTAEPVAFRPASRLLCCDPDDRVLLLNWRDPYDGFELWEPPGGGIESGETQREAVLREWTEETGLEPPELVGGPARVGRDLLWLGERYVSDEFFFLGRAVTAETPDVSGQTEIEQTSYLGHRWVPWQQLADLGGTDQPDVLSVLRRLDPAGRWAGP
jgi:8-oxo-dGTP pyrophosphatase MutT (NUDIX family)/GNAT superfamily N-acetyltransferase